MCKVPFHGVTSAAERVPAEQLLLHLHFSEGQNPTHTLEISYFVLRKKYLSDRKTTWYSLNFSAWILEIANLLLLYT